MSFNKKTFVALLMVLCMVFTLIPANNITKVRADDDEPEWFDEPEEFDEPILEIGYDISFEDEAVLEIEGEDFSPLVGEHDRVWTGENIHPAFHIERYEKEDGVDTIEPEILTLDVDYTVEYECENDAEPGCYTALITINDDEESPREFEYYVKKYVYNDEFDIEVIQQNYYPDTGHEICLAYIDSEGAAIYDGGNTWYITELDIHDGDIDFNSAVTLPVVIWAGWDRTDEEGENLYTVNVAKSIYDIQRYKLLLNSERDLYTEDEDATLIYDIFFVEDNNEYLSNDNFDYATGFKPSYGIYDYSTQEVFYPGDMDEEIRNDEEELLTEDDFESGLSSNAGWYTYEVSNEAFSASATYRLLTFKEAGTDDTPDFTVTLLQDEYFYSPETGPVIVDFDAYDEFENTIYPERIEYRDNDGAGIGRVYVAYEYEDSHFAYKVIEFPIIEDEIGDEGDDDANCEIILTPETQTNVQWMRDDELWYNGTDEWDPIPSITVIDSCGNRIPNEEIDSYLYLASLDPETGDFIVDESGDLRNKLDYGAYWGVRYLVVKDYEFDEYDYAGDMYYYVVPTQSNKIECDIDGTSYDYTGEPIDFEDDICPSREYIEGTVTGSNGKWWDYNVEGDTTEPGTVNLYVWTYRFDTDDDVYYSSDRVIEVDGTYYLYTKKYLGQASFEIVDTRKEDKSSAIFLSSYGDKTEFSLPDDTSFNVAFSIPSDLRNDTDAVWTVTSSDENVLTVRQATRDEWQITIVGLGEATLTGNFTSANYYGTKTLDITVGGHYDAEVSVDDTNDSFYVNDTTMYEAQVNIGALGDDNARWEWTIEDDEVVDFDEGETGLTNFCSIIAVGEGTTTITVTFESDSYGGSYSFDVTVSIPETIDAGLVIDEEDFDIAWSEDDFSLSASISSNVAQDGTWEWTVDGNAVSIDDGEDTSECDFVIWSLGTVTITCTYTAEYTYGEASIEVNVVKSEEEITLYPNDTDIATSSEVAFGYNKEISFSAEVVDYDNMSNPSWTWSVSNENIASLEANGDEAVLCIKDTGTVTVSVEFDSTEIEGSATFELTIVPNANGVTVFVDDGYYTGNEVKPSVMVVSNDGDELESDEYTLTWSDNINVGTAYVTVTSVSGGHYNFEETATFTIEKGEYTVPATISQNILLSSGEASIVLPVPPAGSTYSVSNIDDSESIIDDVAIMDGKLLVALADDAEAGKNATITILATGGNYENYSFEVVVTAVDMEEIEMNIVWNEVETLTYGDDDLILSVDISTTDGTLSWSTNNSSVVNVDMNGRAYITGAGDAVITCRYQSSEKFAEATLNLTIEPAEITIVSVNVRNKYYDGNTVAEISRYELSGLVGDDTVFLSGYADFSDKSAGKDKTVSVYGFSLVPGENTSISNYAFNASVTKTTTANIMPATVTVDGIGAVTRAYDGSTSVEFDYSNVAIDGLMSGETLTVSASGTYSNADAGNGKIITLDSLEISGNANYVIDTENSQTEVEGNILKREVKLSDNFQISREYDGTNFFTVFCSDDELSNIVNGDFVTVSLSGSFDSSQVGTQGINDVMAEIGSLDAENYYFNSNDISSISAEIVPANLYFNKIDVNNKEYDGTDSAVVSEDMELAGIVNGDNVSYSISTAKFSDKNVGENKEVLITFSLDGEDCDNYNLAPVTVKANITPKQLTVSGDITAEDKIYDGKTDATLNVSNLTLSGVLNNDVVSVSAAGEFTDAKVGNDKTVIVKFTLSGADKNNYTVEDKTLTASIKSTGGSSGGSSGGSTGDSTGSSTGGSSGDTTSGSTGDSGNTPPSGRETGDAKPGEAKPVTADDGILKNFFPITENGDAEKSSVAELFTHDIAPAAKDAPTVDDDAGWELGGGSVSVPNAADVIANIIGEKLGNVDFSTVDVSVSNGKSGTVTTINMQTDDGATVTRSITEKSSGTTVTTDTFVTEDGLSATQKLTEKPNGDYSLKASSTDADGKTIKASESKSTNDETGVVTEKHSYSNEVTGESSKSTLKTESNGDYTLSSSGVDSEGNKATAKASRQTNEDGTVTETLNQKDFDGSTTKSKTTTEANGDFTSSSVTKDASGDVVAQSESSKVTDKATGSVQEDTVVQNADGNSEFHRTTEVNEQGNVTNISQSETNVNGETTEINMGVNASGKGYITSVVSDAQTVNLPASLHSGIGTDEMLAAIKAGAFKDCLNMKTLNMVEKVKFEKNALKGAQNLKSITLKGAGNVLKKGSLSSTSKKLVINVSTKKEQKAIKKQISKAGNNSVKVKVLKTE